MNQGCRITMQIRFAFAVTVMFLFGHIAAQTFPPVKSLAKFWAKGEMHNYRFQIEDEERGQLSAELVNVEGRGSARRYTLHENLHLELGSGEDRLILAVKSESVIDDNGRLIASTSEIAANDRTQTVRVRYDPEKGVIIGTRSNGNEVPLNIQSEEAPYLLDRYMLDQLEVLLALQRLVPGDTLEIPVYVPQEMLMTTYRFYVLGPVQANFGSVKDTVWHVNQIFPSTRTIYIDKHHRLLQYYDDDQNLSAGQDIDLFSHPKATTPETVSGVMTKFVRRMPIFGAFSLVCVVLLIVVSRDAFTFKWAYVGFVAGGLAYFLVYVTQQPLQQWYAKAVMFPGVQSGESLFVLGIVVALMAAVIRQLLVLGVLTVIWKGSTPGRAATVSLGAFVGAGFAFVGACKIAGPLFQMRTLTSMILLEQVYNIALHIGAGALLGLGLASSRALRMLLVVILIQAVAGYIIIFVQAQLMSVETLQTILGVYYAVFLAAVIYGVFRYRRTLAPSKKKIRR
jgi:hypothetical protein